MVVVPPSRHTRKRAPLLFWRERWMVAFVFAAVLLVGLIVTYEPVLSARTTPAEIVEAILWGVLVAALLSLALERIGRLWHQLANAFLKRRCGRL